MTSRVLPDHEFLLLRRYLQESGFVHSSFSFIHESMMGRTGLRSINKTVPPGALVTFLQKGLQYVEIEERLNRESASGKTDSDLQFSLLSPATVSAITRQNPTIQLNVSPAAASAAVKARLEVQSKLEEGLRTRTITSSSSVSSLNGTSALLSNQTSNVELARRALQSQAGSAATSQIQPNQPTSASEALHQQNATVVEMEGVEITAGPGGKRGAPGSKRSGKKQKTTIVDGQPDTARKMGFTSIEEVDSKGMDGVDGQGPANQGQESQSLPQQLVNGESHSNGGHSKTGSSQQEGGSSKRDLPPVDDTATAAKSEEILKLDMHQSEVFMCAWNPVFTNLIATGSGDASARIWEMGGVYASDGLSNVKLLPHGSDTRDLKNKDVTTLEWSSSGELLATGSYDGVARIWSRFGALLHTLQGHSGPIFSLKWNKLGNYLLSGSYDKTTIVWDVMETNGQIVQQFTDHQAPALDVDWKDNETFASCSTDKTVQVCKVGTSMPLKVYAGHTDEVNGVKWDPSGKYLASCSDDCTAKVWEVESDRTGPLHDFNLHSEEIYTLKWSPQRGKSPLLATASFDGTVMLWSIEDGSLYRKFDRHRDSVYSVAFSPSGMYLASGSLAGQMYVWDIEKGRQIMSYKGTGDIFEVAWNKEETRIAGCFSSNIVAVVDFKVPSSS